MAETKEVSGLPGLPPPLRRVRVGESMVAIGVFAILALLPLLFSGYIIYILPQYMLFGVLAMSLALLWGFCGILSFGQAGFFALGAYTMGFCMQHADSLGVNAAYVALLISIVAGAVIAGVVGYFLFSAGVRDSYFVIVTLALSIIAEQIAVGQSQITGGWNGMFIPRVALSFWNWKIPLESDPSIYYVIVVFVAATYFFMRWVTRAKFGKVLAGIRENEDRVLSLGFKVPLYKTATFAISAALACMAGALYGTHAAFVAPSLAGVLFSTEVVVWVAIAGRSSLIGALLGGIVVSSMSNALSAITPQYWQLLLGMTFVVVVAFFRGGIAGAVQRFSARQER
jgi:urea transport system permease protein